MCEFDRCYVSFKSRIYVSAPVRWSQKLLNELSKSIDYNDEHNYKIYLDVDIQINYRLANEYASKNDFSNSIIHLN